MTRHVKTLAIAAIATALAFLLQASPALAASGSITNVHAVDGEVEATYTTTMDICDGTYCGWFAHAYQYPASQSCAPNGAYLTYVGSVHGDSGSETAGDRFTPHYDGALRICLYAYQAGSDYFIAEATFTPSSSMSGAITNIHAISGGRVEATYASNFNHCVAGYCGWFPEAWQYPSSQSCAPNGAHLTYVGDVHTGSGSETANDDFYPEFGAVRICLYARQADSYFLLAEAVYFSSPAPNRYVRLTIGNQEVLYYYPRSCVTPGREVQLKVVSKKRKKSKGAATAISRVDFSIDQLKKTDKRKAWQKSFSTEGFPAGSNHRAAVKITFKQPHGKKVKRTVKKSFRIC